MTIIKRADLGRPLTWDELDDNFQQVDDLTAAASAAVSSATASATAAASSATGAASSAVDAANSAANAAASTANAVKSTGTFTTGGTLSSNLDRISDGTYLYYWTGAYPVTVPAGSTVSGTGGVGIGFWAVDNDQLLRTEFYRNGLTIATAFGTIGVTLDTLTYTSPGITVGAHITSLDTGAVYEVLSAISSSADITGQAGLLCKVVMINGEVSIQAWNVTGDGVANDTVYIQGAIDSIMNRGGGTLKITGTNKTYLFDSIVINRSKTPNNNFDLRLTIEGDGSAILQHSGDLANDSAFWAYGNLGSGASADVYARGLTLRNLYISGNPTSNARGVRLERSSSFYLERVIIENFGNTGLYLLDAYDTAYVGVEVLRCGRVTDSSVANYGVLISGSYDQSNANHFFGLRVEHCPLILAINKGCRHNYFNACKFEQGRVNPTISNPIYIAAATETAFDECQFVQNFTSDIHYMVITTDTTSYWTTYGTEKLIQFSDCSFVCSSGNLAYWLNVNYTSFDNCVFSSCAGATAACFILGQSVSMNNPRIVMGSASASVFRISGSKVTVTDTKVTHFVSPTAGAFLSFTNAASLSDVRFENFSFQGYEPLNPYSGHIDNMGDIIIRRKQGYTLSTTNDRLVFGPDVLIYTGSTAVTWTNMRNGYNGQRVTVYASGASITFDVSAGTIITTSGTNLTLAVGSVANFVHVSGIWRQI